MATNFDLSSSFEDITAQVSLLKESVGVSEVPLVNDENVIELQNTTQYHVACAASELMTGVRWRRERQAYLKTYDVYRQLLGAVALDIAGRSYDQAGDIGKVKQDVFGYLQDSKQRMVTLDYRRRLEESAFERQKQWLAQHPKERFVLPIALSAITTGALYKAGEASSSFVELTPSQGGLLGMMTVMGALAIRSALRNGPRQAGAVLKNQFNASLRTYMLEGPSTQDDEEVSTALDDLPEQYAARHLTLPFGAAAIYLVNCEVSGRQGFEPMIEGLLDITEESLHESYGIDVKAGEGPWYKRLPSRLLRVDLAS